MMFLVFFYCQLFTKAQLKKKKSDSMNSHVDVHKNQSKLLCDIYAGTLSKMAAMGSLSVKIGMIFQLCIRLLKTMLS